MKTYNIMFTGVGGSGVLTAARVLATAALNEGHKVRMGEIHGMAQRGGIVNCAIRIGESVYGPIIPMGEADLLLSIEPVEALRQANLISPKGTIIVGEYKITPTAVMLGRAEYPSVDEIFDKLSKFARVITFNAERMAREAGGIMTMNTVLVGAAFDLDLIPMKEISIIEAIKDVLPARYHEMNITAFKKGMAVQKMTITD